ncbi:hypothetical protein B0T25DRAFT_342496 [Lasiosphaeria hispida]|uniref:Mid2 domain-containing protein n=1 Tax=Lasiosphaeria hispida TaxID=260671 RepID=A0AAJ0H6G8_9PEZI|nr:hypothetical protein B0T25DRAFT_342496 [Lasiosphaeria hispida]
MCEIFPSMRRPRLAIRVAALAAILATTSASAIPLNDLFQRQSTCAANFSRCNVANFPSSFCCPTSQTCIALAGNTTLLCCPAGFNCAKIQPISCDISQQDAEKHPDSTVKTTALQGSLEKCGKLCCPFGYSCSGDECVKDKNQSAAPSGAPSSTASPSTSTSTSTSTRPASTSAATRVSSAAPTISTSSAAAATSTPSSTETETETASPANTSPSSTSETAISETSTPSSGPPVAAIIGATAGAALLIIVAVVLVCCLLKRKKNKKQPDQASLKLSRSTSSFGNIISNPIIAEGTTIRSDFNRVPVIRTVNERGSLAASLMRASMSSSGSSTSRKPSPRTNALRQSSVAYGYGGPPPYGSPGYPRGNTNLQPPPPPQTPRQDREPSSVSINVFADPFTLTPESASRAAGDPRRHSSLTTFTQMMEEADLGSVRRGEAYVPYKPDSVQGSPRKETSQK